MVICLYYIDRDPDCPYSDLSAACFLMSRCKCRPFYYQMDSTYDNELQFLILLLINVSAENAARNLIT